MEISVYGVMIRGVSTVLMALWQLREDLVCVRVIAMCWSLRGIRAVCCAMELFSFV
jgi:hypothetical protein